MSSTNTNDITEKEATSARTSNRNNRDDEGFPAFIVIILLMIIWILTNFTVFICAVLLVLMTKTSGMRNSTIATNNTSSSLHSQMRCSSTMTDETTCESLTNTNDLNAMNVRESEAQLDSNEKPQSNREEIVEQDVGTEVLTNAITQLSERDATEIAELISADDTSAVLLTLNIDNIIETSSSVRMTTDSTISALPSERQTLPVPAAIRQSAFVTESVMKMAVSYSGKERKRVVKIVRFLQNRMVTSECSDPVFFDQDYQDEVCRLDGLRHLLSIYRQAQLVIVFLSPTYTDSRYCTGEWRTIAQRFLSNGKNKNATQLLLVKLGQYDMEQLGLVDNDFAVDEIRMNNTQIGELILRRWNLVEKNLENNDQ